MPEGDQSPIVIRCKLCRGPTVPFVTGYVSYRLCTECGEKWPIFESRPPITIREYQSVPDRADDALNELTKLQYEDDDERIRNLGG